MNKFVFDSNILIYIINGGQEIELVANKIYKQASCVLVSDISRVEVLGYSRLTTVEIKEIGLYFKENLECVPVLDQTINKAIHFCRNYNIKAVDSIVAATAFLNNAILISHDKIFSRVQELQLWDPFDNKEKI